MSAVLKKIIVALCLGFAITTVVAQEIEPNALANAGMQVLSLVEQGKLGEVWDGASPVAKKMVDRAKFIADISKTLAPLGKAKAREWYVLTKTDSAANGSLPAGRYATVEFQTDFANGKRLREVLSFRFDEDKTWRFTGYFLR